MIRCAEVSHQLVEQGLVVPLPGAEPSGPRPPATPAQIAAAEARIGARLDPDARALLSRANGWVGLTGRFTLLSCEEIGGPDWADLIELRDIFFESCPPDSWPHSVVDPQVLIPIVVVPYSPETIYVFPSESNDGPRPALNTGLDPIPEITLKQAIEVSLAQAVADLNAITNGARDDGEGVSRAPHLMNYATSWAPSRDPSSHVNKGPHRFCAWFSFPIATHSRFCRSRTRVN